MRQHFLQEISKQLHLDCMAPKNWYLVLKEMKQVTTLNEFKTKIKIWKLENYLYRLCRAYSPQIILITYWLLT